MTIVVGTDVVSVASCGTSRTKDKFDRCTCNIVKFDEAADGCAAFRVDARCSLWALTFLVYVGSFGKHVGDRSCVKIPASYLVHCRRTVFWLVCNFFFLCSTVDFDVCVFVVGVLCFRAFLAIYSALFRYSFPQGSSGWLGHYHWCLLYVISMDAEAWSVLSPVRTFVLLMTTVLISVMRNSSCMKFRFLLILRSKRYRIPTSCRRIGVLNWRVLVTRCWNCKFSRQLYM